MSGSGSPTAPKMVDAGKAAAVDGIETPATAQDRVGVVRREAEDPRMKQLIHEQLSMFFAIQESSMPPAAVGEENAIPSGNESRMLVVWTKNVLCDARGFSALPSTACSSTCLVNLIFRRQWTSTTTSRATGPSSPASLAIELRKLLAAACVTDGIPPAFGQRLEAVVHSMEAVGDGHRFRLAYLRMQWDTQMHNGDTFALDVVQRERYLRLGIENLGSPEFAPLLELYKHRVNDANIASKRCEDISMSALCGEQ
eukprot:jgi/Tetstr1/424854/TSEL_015356.t2